MFGFGKSANLVPAESSFGRIHTNRLLINEAKGKIEAAKAAITAQNEEIAEVTKLAEAVHELHDEQDVKINNLFALLG